MMSSPSLTTSRRRRHRTSTVCGLVLLAASSSCVSTAHGALCSQSQQTELATFLDANKSIFQSCLSDLKLSASSSSKDTWTRFISDDYLQDANADSLCASTNCAKALITAMEKLPDCCSSSSSSSSTVRNLPRLADDLLHLCDVRDAALLAKELEAEIAKLPDLKVQIKSMGNDLSTNNSNGSSSSTGETVGTSDGNTGGDGGGGVDVIIDVKKRELMKSGALNLGNNETESKSTAAASASSGLHHNLLNGALVVVATAVWTAFQFV